jgi:hypothetical protein
MKSYAESDTCRWPRNLCLGSQCEPTYFVMSRKGSKAIVGRAARFSVLNKCSFSTALFVTPFQRFFFPHQQRSRSALCGGEDFVESRDCYFRKGRNGKDRGRHGCAGCGGKGVALKLTNLVAWMV